MIDKNRAAELDPSAGVSCSEDELVTSLLLSSEVPEPGKAEPRPLGKAHEVFPPSSPFSHSPPSSSFSPESKLSCCEALRAGRAVDEMVRWLQPSCCHGNQAACQIYSQRQIQLSCSRTTVPRMQSTQGLRETHFLDSVQPEPSNLEEDMYGHPQKTTVQTVRICAGGAESRDTSGGGQLDIQAGGQQLQEGTKQRPEMFTGPGFATNLWYFLKTCSQNWAVFSISTSFHGLILDGRNTPPTGLFASKGSSPFLLHTEARVTFLKCNSDYVASCLPHSIPARLCKLFSV